MQPLPGCEPTSENNIANVAGAAALALADVVDRAVSGASHNDVTMAALVHITKYPGATVDDLRMPLELSHSGCVRLVDRLVDEGLAERRAHRDDGRAVALHPTRAGLRLAQNKLGARILALRGVLSVLSSSEKKMFAALVSKLLMGSVGSEGQALRVCRFCDYDACTCCPVRATFEGGGS